MVVELEGKRDRFEWEKKVKTGRSELKIGTVKTREETAYGGS